MKNQQIFGIFSEAPSSIACPAFIVVKMSKQKADKNSDNPNGQTNFKNKTIGIVIKMNEK